MKKAAMSDVPNPSPSPANPVADQQRRDLGLAQLESKLAAAEIMLLQAREGVEKTRKGLQYNDYPSPTVSSALESIHASLADVVANVSVAQTLAVRLAAAKPISPNATFAAAVNAIT
jgi:hypothetical protein